MSYLNQFNKQNGVVYTPSNLAQYVADKLTDYFLQDKLSSNKMLDRGSSAQEIIRIIDPACGNGELLIALANALSRRFRKISSNVDAKSTFNVQQILCGIDNDPNAIYKSQAKIESLFHRQTDQFEFRLLYANALYPFENVSSMKGWVKAKALFNSTNGFDLLIANPPWGADISYCASSLSEGEFSLYKGQFDTSDLFVELSLRIVRPGGYFAFIVPDSLFNKERAQLRHLLLDNTELKYIARLGEKIFPGINRACALLICKNGKQAAKSKVDCFRLTSQLRKQILLNQSTFKEAENQLLHKVPQSRFVNNQDYSFDIYLKENERDILALMGRYHTTFRQYLYSTRGVELSKTGKVGKCPNCSNWFPYPRATSPKCINCGKPLTTDSIESSFIISGQQKPGYKPMLAGEAVDRYIINAHHWIDINRSGINYKDKKTYQSPKIVVRKTGVGLLAALDYHSLMTNQVVYIFKKTNPNDKFLPIEFFLAILNSRAIYYYLVKTSGETEWRSHPYLTQNQILDLPLPLFHDYSIGRHLSHTIQEIVLLIKPHLKAEQGLPPDVDAKLEYLISTLYGLSQNHYDHIYDTLKDVQQLLPIKALKTVTVNDIFQQ